MLAHKIIAVLALTLTGLLAGAAGPAWKTAPVDGGALAYVEQGRGPPLLLIHGGLQDHRAWQDLMPVFAKRYRVIAVSRRNHWPGPVAADGTPDGAADLHGDDMAALATALKLGRVRVVAHSAGAHAALFFAQRHPDKVEALVLNEPPARGVLAGAEGGAALEAFQGQLQPAMAAFRAGEVDLALRRFADAVGGPGGYDRRTPFQVQMMRDNALAHVADATTARPRPTFTCEMARQIQAPVLLTSGDRSLAYFHAVAGALARCLPNVRRETIEAYHGGPYENPAAFGAAAMAFLGATSQR
jgi:non-heme chloroperoxidase